MQTSCHSAWRNRPLTVPIALDDWYMVYFCSCTGPSAWQVLDHWLGVFSGPRSFLPRWHSSLLATFLITVTKCLIGTTSREERYTLANGFKDASPSWWRTCGGAEQVTSWWSESRERVYRKRPGKDAIPKDTPRDLFPSTRLYLLCIHYLRVMLAYYECIKESSHSLRQYLQGLVVCVGFSLLIS